MLRTLLLFIALLIVISIALIWTGVINFSRSGEGVRIEKRDVEVGTTVKNVQVPVVRMENRQVEVPSVGVENATANAQ
jgi:hypothetical protein